MTYKLHFEKLVFVMPTKQKLAPRICILRERAGVEIQKERFALMEEQLELHNQGRVGLREVEKEEVIQGT